MIQKKRITEENIFYNLLIGIQLFPHLVLLTIDGLSVRGLKCVAMF